jgi:hypothetical protein
MKGLVAAIAVAALMGVGGAAYGQYDYQSTVPGYGGYGQDYGQGVGQYGQTLSDYSQYAQGQGAYGQQYMPYQQGTQGGNYPGYGGYQGYGGYENPQEYNPYQGYGPGRGAPYAGYQQQQTQQRRAPRQPAQYQTTRPRQPRAAVTERTAPQPSTGASVQPSGRESSSIYWDGREAGSDTSQGAGVQAPVQSAQPQYQPNVRQQVRSAPGAVRSPGRPSRAAAKQESASVPSPPARKNVQWGKQDIKASDRGRVTVNDEQEKPDTRRSGSQVLESPVRSQSSMKWGKQDRPSIVGAEPGSSPEARGVTTGKESGAREALETQSSAKKFEWGKTAR